MSVNKYKMLRFQALDACFSDRLRYYYIEDLIAAVNRTLRNNDTEIQSVSKRTVQYDIAEMEGNHDWDVIFEEPGKLYGRRYYRYRDPNYSIFKKDLTEEQLSELKSTLVMLSQFKGLPQFNHIQEMVHNLEHQYGFILPDYSHVIEFGTNMDLKGIEHLSILLESIVKHQTMKIDYVPYAYPPFTVECSPYFLKQYNGRWFLFAWNPDEKMVHTYALDRMEKVRRSHRKFVENTEIDFESYFDDAIGVTINSEMKPEHVVLKFTPNRIPYVVSKPLYPYQNNSRSGEGIITMDIMINKELVQQLLSFGADVEVLEPKSLRDMMRDSALRMAGLYSADKNSK